MFKIRYNVRTPPTAPRCSDLDEIWQGGACGMFYMMSKFIKGTKYKVGRKIASKKLYVTRKQCGFGANKN